MSESFESAARAEAERVFITNDPYYPDRDAADLRAQGFAEGAEWARSYLLAREPTDAEAQAYLAAFSGDLPADTEWTPDTIARVKRDAAREALDGYAKTLDDLTAPAPHLEAERVRHYRDTHHPATEETP